MFYADKPRRSEKSRDISLTARIGEKYAVRGFTVSTRVEHAQVVLAQRKQNGSVPAPKIGWVSQRIWWYLRLFDIRQYFNGKKIQRILKLYGLFSSQNEILEQTEVCRDFFRRVTAEIPDSKKLVTRSVKRCLPSVKRFSK